MRNDTLYTIQALNSARNDAYANNPWLQIGNNLQTATSAVAAPQMGRSDLSWKDYLAIGLSNLVSGGFQGYGRQDAENQFRTSARDTLGIDLGDDTSNNGSWSTHIAKYLMDQEKKDQELELRKGIISKAPDILKMGGNVDLTNNSITFPDADTLRERQEAANQFELEKRAVSGGNFTMEDGKIQAAAPVPKTQKPNTNQPVSVDLMSDDVPFNEKLKASEGNVKAQSFIYKQYDTNRKELANELPSTVKNINLLNSIIENAEAGMKKIGGKQGQTLSAYGSYLADGAGLDPEYREGLNRVENAKNAMTSLNYTKGMGNLNKQEFDSFLKRAVSVYNEPAMNMAIINELKDLRDRNVGWLQTMQEGGDQFPLDRLAVKYQAQQLSRQKQGEQIKQKADEGSNLSGLKTGRQGLADMGF